MDGHTNPLAFNSGFAPEPLKGHPTSVRLERRDFQGAGSLNLQRVDFLANGKIAVSYSYEPDGSVIYRNVYEYSDGDQTTTESTFDRADKLVQIIRTVQADNQIEQTVTNAEGKIATSTITRLDERGRPVEAVLTNHDDSSKWRVLQHYDAEGRSLGGEVVFEGMPPGFPTRIVIPARQDLALTTAYASDGTVIFANELESETTQEGTATEVSRTQFAGGGQQRATVERIDSIDTEGNWTKKTIFAGTAPDQQEKPVAEVYRTITYYEAEYRDRIPTT